MNERIKELSNKAVLSASATYAPGPDAIWLKEYNKKFAELIVVECISTLNKRFMGDLNREDMEVRKCIEDVKKHFGVE